MSASHRVPYPSVEAMIEPSELERLLGRTVSTVTVTPVQRTQTSTDARFAALILDGESAPSLFMKQVDPSTDWVALLTDDGMRRAVTVWSEGVLARMPPEVDAAVIACSSWEGGYAVLMPDVTAHLVPLGSRMTPAASDAVLDGMAAMHAHHWEDARLADDRLGLCPPELFLSHTSPLKATRMRRQLGSFVFDAIEDGWGALRSFMDPGLVGELRALNDDPTPILTALNGSPRTLVHSDIRPANLGLRPRPTGGFDVIVIDWGRPIFTAPTVDLGYYLGWTTAERASDVDTAIAMYEEALARRLGPLSRWGSWQRWREVGILGGALNTICFRAMAARGADEVAVIEREALSWWGRRLRDTLRYL